MPPLQKIERLFLVAVLLFCAGAFMPVLDGDTPGEMPQAQQSNTNSLQAKFRDSDPTKKNPLKLMVQLSLYGGVAFLLFVHRQEALRQLRQIFPLTALFIFAAISLLWSDLAAFAARRWLVLVASSACGLLLSVLYSPRQLLRLLGGILVASAVLSILCVVFVPSWGIDPLFQNGSWRGIFAQKNTLGRLMVLGVIIQFLLMMDDRSRRKMYGVGLLLCSLVLVMTKSATSAMIAPGLLALLPLFRWLRRRPFWVVATVAVLIVMAGSLLVVVTGTSDHVFELVGRDSSLSGRVDIWEVVLPQMMEHPWLGYGFSSFWLGLESAQSAYVWSVMKWNVPHSHNAFLDLVQEIGLVGLGIFLYGFVIAVRHSIAWLRWNSSYLALWPILFLSFTFLSNLSEDSLLKQDNLFWLLYVSTWIFLSVTVPVLERSPKSVVSPVVSSPSGALNMEGAR